MFMIIGDGRTSSMKDCRPNPHVHVKDVERNIIRPHRMFTAYSPP